MIPLDGGPVRPGRESYGEFDAAACSPDGDVVALYQRLGSRGLVLRDGEVVRDIRRTDSQATTYEYPITFVTLPDGRVVLAHCPGSPFQLVLDDPVRGERLATGEMVQSFYHSRLAASPSGRRLLSAGWGWHPWDIVLFFDLPNLDGLHQSPHSNKIGLTEESAAVWLDDEHVVMAGSEWPEEDEELGAEHPETRLQPRGLAVYHVTSGKCLSSIALADPPGTLMAVGRDHVVAFYHEPKLLCVSTGKVLHRWKGVPSGLQVGSILWATPPVPPLALDPLNRRFAVAHADGITVVTLQ